MATALTRNSGKLAGKLLPPKINVQPVIGVLRDGESLLLESLTLEEVRDAGALLLGDRRKHLEK